MTGIKSLLYSRKFWLTCWALAQTILMHYADIPIEIIALADALVGILIGSIAYEDAGQAQAEQPKQTLTVVAPTDDTAGKTTLKTE